MMSDLEKVIPAAQLPIVQHIAQQKDPAHRDSQQRVATVFREARWRAGSLLLFLILCELGFCIKGLPRSLSGDVDFRVFYASGRLVASGQGSHLYQYEAQRQAQIIFVGGEDRTLPFLYPPFSALLFAPLAHFSYRTAFILFGGVNLCLLWLCARLMRRCIPSWGLISTTPIAAAFFCALPVVMACMQGQVSILLLTIYTACLALLRKGRMFLAGIILAAALIKLQIALPIIVLFICWRRWRVISGVVTGTVLLATVSLVVSGLHGSLEYLSSLANIAGETFLRPALAHQRYGMFAADMPNLHGFLFFLTQGSQVGQYLFLVSSILLVFWASRQKSSLCLALPVSMLVSYHMQAYDLTLLLLPLSIAMGNSTDSLVQETSLETRHRERVARRLPVLLSAACLTLPIAPFLLVLGLSCFFILPIIAMIWQSRSEQDS